MNLLLDTHIVLWWLNDDPKLTDTHRTIICNTENLCHISSATIWEISIKSKLGKLTIPNKYAVELKKEGFLELPVSWRHTDSLKELPLIHNDPFDRLLISQALLEGMTMLSVDEHMKKYNIKVL